MDLCYNSFSLTTNKVFSCWFYTLDFVVWSVGVFWFVVLLLLFFVFFLLMFVLFFSIYSDVRFCFNIFYIFFSCLISVKLRAHLSCFSSAVE